MPKRKRYPPKSRSRPTQIQRDTQNQSEGQSLSQTQDDAENPLSTYKRKSNKYWIVDVIDEEGVVKETNLRVQDMFVLPMGKKVVLEWNNRNQPVGESAGLLGGFLGSIASNFEYFPIGFEKWPKIPKPYKEHVWTNTIKPKFQVNDEMNKKYILGNIGRKWRDKRIKLFDENYDPSLGKDANIDLPPAGISKDQWALFLNYRLNEKTMEISCKNRVNRQKQTVPHILGSRSIARTMHELEIKAGRPYTRGQMYSIAHKKKDGSFVNDEARQRSEQLNMQADGTSSEADTYINVWGKEHPGRARGMGFGVCPSQLFRSTCSSGGSPVSPSSGVPSNTEWQAMKLELQESKSKVKALESELQKSKSRFKVLEDQMSYLYQNFAGQRPLGFPNSTANQVADLRSPVEIQHSSSASHEPQGRGTSAAA
ncbi:uncharacterized LOC107815048 [Nicotiana tabacum]|uniref:6b-interacting protein 2 n=1 Tax=Nicotiana tabacum TaxID=4097 RepID=B1B5X5_TOBAC|nr:uncharacterized LOC107815048 [Nicotiana tabacum]BAG12304.1 6b-interacting protein 2 [Nicotiana tabacum]